MIDEKTTHSFVELRRRREVTVQVERLRSYPTDPAPTFTCDHCTAAHTCAHAFSELGLNGESPGWDQAGLERPVETADARNGDYTEGELRATLATMRAVADHVYWHMFKQGIGARCHAMLEFCGLISLYVGLCEEATDEGIQFPFVNTHSGTALPMSEHQAAYLAEKFDCIFGAYFKHNPAAARLFAEQALGLTSDEER